MTDEPKHSPLPWTAEFGEMAGYDCMTNGYSVHDAERNVVLTVDSGDYGQDRFAKEPHVLAVGNTELIVRRVNEGPKVDELLAIAEGMANLILGTQNLGYSNYTLAAGKAREFLKAKEEKP